MKMCGFVLILNSLVTRVTVLLIFSLEYKSFCAEILIEDFIFMIILLPLNMYEHEAQRIRHWVAFVLRDEEPEFSVSNLYRRKRKIKGLIQSYKRQFRSSYSNLPKVCVHGVCRGCC